MKRDMDLVRELLLKLEAEPLDGNLWSLDVEGFGIAAHTYEEVAYHMVLLIDCGMLDGAREQSGGFVARKLTCAGHDFIDSTRDHTVWQKTEEMATRAGGFSVDLLVGIAKEVIKQNIAKLTGGSLGL